MPEGATQNLSHEPVGNGRALPALCLGINLRGIRLQLFAFACFVSGTTDCFGDHISKNGDNFGTSLGAHVQKFWGALGELLGSSFIILRMCLLETLSTCQFLNGVGRACAEGSIDSLLHSFRCDRNYGDFP